jgi:hypothetical protein
VPGHVRIQRFRTRPRQIVHALLLPEHPLLGVVDVNAIIKGVGIDRTVAIAEQLSALGLNPQPGTWLILEGTAVIGWAASMDDMDPL